MKLKTLAATATLMVSMLTMLWGALPQMAESCEPLPVAVQQVSACCDMGCCADVEHCGCALGGGSHPQDRAVLQGITTGVKQPYLVFVASPAVGVPRIAIAKIAPVQRYSSRMAAPPPIYILKRSLVI